MVIEDEPAPRQQIAQKAKAMFETMFKPVKAFKTWLGGKKSSSELMLLN